MLSSSLGPPNPFVLLAFGGVVLLAVLLAIAAVMIRHSLPRAKDKKRKSDCDVHAGLFGNRLRYDAGGPLGEFVVVFGTLAFVALIFWVIIVASGGRQ